MNTVFIAKPCSTMVSGDEALKLNSTEESGLAFPHRSQNVVSAIAMAVTDQCLGWIKEKNDPLVLWNEVREKYHIPAGATVDAFLT